ncbi:hypothetical protein COOONC_07076 [Cooperia oncophora]
MHQGGEEHRKYHHVEWGEEFESLLQKSQPQRNFLSSSPSSAKATSPPTTSSKFFGEGEDQLKDFVHVSWKYKFYDVYVGRGNEKKHLHDQTEVSATRPSMLQRDTLGVVSRSKVPSIFLFYQEFNETIANTIEKLRRMLPSSPMQELLMVYSLLWSMLSINYKALHPKILLPCAGQRTTTQKHLCEG